VPSGASILSGATKLAFSDLKVGLQVQIHGSMQGSVVNAQEIDVEDAVEPEPEPGEIQFSGTVSAVDGGCPAVTLTVAGKKVTTSGATEFAKAACGDIKIGATVEVKGTAQADGSVAASRVQVDDSGSGSGK
jgi:hypothetical protein